MNTDAFNALVDAAQARERELLRAKGHDYTRADLDRLYNFKSVAERLGLTPLQVWGVYFEKHVLSVETLIKTGRLESEPIQGRIDDVRCYALLLEALIADNESGGVYENE